MRTRAARLERGGPFRIGALAMVVARRIKGHKVAASKDNPEYLVDTGEGKRAAHKPGALSKD